MVPSGPYESLTVALVLPLEAQNRSMKPEKPSRPGRSLLIRAAIVGAVVVLLTAGAVSFAAFQRVDQVTDAFLGSEDQQIKTPSVTRAEAGQAQTFILLGSDQRWDDKKHGVPGRSDTIMLIRIDPDQSSIAAMSIPRDLRVPVKGHTEKINAAYALGGPDLTVKTVKEVFESATHKPFEINKIINASFGGFERAVNWMGGVYVDVDHHYFNDNSGRDKYATINIKAGYQLLRGKEALDFARFRHTDSDFLRGARQQDLMRQIRSQPNAQRLLNFDNLDEVGKMLSKYLQVDDSFRSSKQILSLMKLLIHSRGKPVRQVKFNAGYGMDKRLGSYVVATPEQIRQAWKEFMFQPAAPKREPQTAASNKRKRSKTGSRSSASAAGIQNSVRAGEDQAIVLGGKVGFQLYFPAVTRLGSTYANTQSRAYKIIGPGNRKYDAYRLVLNKRGTVGEYYGVQGTTWKNPPILDNPSETRTVKGKKLELFYDGSKLRLVAWRTNEAAYWVTNTLNRSMDNRQMIAIAGSLTKLGKH
jgi:LCP family protein required for cell wall assembly